jgi:hypothetical protein
LPRSGTDRRRYFVSQLETVGVAGVHPHSLEAFVGSELRTRLPEAFLPHVLSQWKVAKWSALGWILKVCVCL